MMEDHNPITGVIVTRNCPTCGHHEVGIETREGEFQALRPGDMVALLSRRQSSLPVQDIPVSGQQAMADDAGDLSEYRAWAPLPVQGIGQLRRKYGILLVNEQAGEKMSPGLYEIGYRQKLQRLIDKEIFTPLPVLLDRYFIAPHLASGDSKQIATALWDEIDEIRDPALLVKDWLENENEENLAKMIQPFSHQDLNKDGISEQDLRHELDTMTLEDFFEML